MGTKKSRSSNKRSSNTSKKQGKKNGNARNTNTAGSNTSSDDNTGSILHVDRGIYQTYKQCTQAVKDWGISTWNQSIGKQHRKKKGRGANTHSTSTSISTSSTMTLTAVVNCLRDLAEAGIAMPSDIGAQLRTAIHLRQQASVHYQNVPSAKESHVAGHAWIIHALRKVRNLFQQQATAAVKKSSLTNTRSEEHRSNSLHSNIGDTTIGGAFDALAMQENEDSDVSLSDDEENGTIPRTTPTPTLTPTTSSQEDLLFEEIAEERCFAIACVLLEVTQTRSDVRDLWKTWAATTAATDKNSVTTSANEDRQEDAKAVGELVAASVSTRYALQMLQTTIRQTSILFPNSLEDFQQILQAFQKSPSIDTARPVSFENGDCVTLHSLQKIEMNGRQGTIVARNAENPTEDGRYPVKLDATGKRKSKVVLIKPGNLVRSDDTFFNLNQVYEALSSFDFTLVPEYDQTVGRGNTAVKVACTRLLIHHASVSQHKRDKSLVSFLAMFTASYLPIWISYAEYGGDNGAADAFMRACLREFHKSRQVKFHTAFAILVMADCAFESRRYSRDGDESHVGCKAMKLMVRTLGSACKRQYYDEAIHLFEQETPRLKTNALHCHYDIINQYRTVWYPMCDLFPWMSGEMLLKGLQMNLVAASGLPYQRHLEFLCLIHLYWLLRSEGYLAPISDIEDTVIRMYRKSVWFRAGLPEKGTSAYLRNWQLALGVRIDSYQHMVGGRSTGRNKNPGMQHFNAEDMTGLHVTEMSRLLGLIQWKSLPIVARKPCFEDIRKIAMEECDKLFLTPLMEVGVKLWHLESHLVQKCLHLCQRFVAGMAPSTTDFTKVCFWACNLGDGCASGGLSEEEKRRGLSELARCFRDIFRGFGDESSASLSATSPLLEFNPNNHTIDPSLRGEKGAKETSYASLL